MNHKGTIIRLASIGMIAFIVVVGFFILDQSHAVARSGGTVLFSDDFSGDLSQWPEADRIGDWSIDQEQLVGTGWGWGTDGWIYAGDNEWTDYVLQADVHFVNGNAILVVRSTGHGYNEYRIDLWQQGGENDNTYTIAKYFYGYQTTLASGTSPVPITNPSTVQVFVIGNRLLLLINGSLVDEVEDLTPLPNGRIGLGVIQYYTTRFDNVFVTTAPPIMMYPPDQAKYGKPGNTVTYTIELENNTGETDSFNLEVLPGSTWITSLSTPQVGPIEDGESISFDVFVDIPPDAEPLDTDTAIIQATSVASPDVVGAASIHTHAMGEETAYVTLGTSNRIAMVDVDSQLVFGQIEAGEYGCNNPWRASMSPDGEFVYFACYSSGSVLVLETDTNSVVTNITGLPYADDVAFTPSGDYALVGSRSYYQVAIVNTDTYVVEQFIYTSGYTRSIAVHPYMPRAYVTVSVGEILVIDTNTFTIIDSIQVGGNPWDIATSPDGSWVFAGDRWGTGLSVIDAATNTIHTVVTGLGELTGIDVSRDSEKIYVGGHCCEVWVIDGNTFSMITSVYTSSTAWELTLTGDGTQLYVGNVSDHVLVIDALNYTVLGSISMPSYPSRGIAITPQYVAVGAFLIPPTHAKSGGRGETVTYQETLYNNSGITETFTLEASSYQWDTQLPVDQIGPIQDGESASFEINVVVPMDAPWYDTDQAMINATGVTSPALTAQAQLITTAYAPAQISIDPTNFSSTQYVGEVTTQDLTISNGEGVTLTYEIEKGVFANDDFSTDTGLWEYIDYAYRDAVNEYVVLTDIGVHSLGIIWLDETVEDPFEMDFRYLAGGGSGADGFVVMFYKDSNYDPDGGGCIAFGHEYPYESCYAAGYGIEFDSFGSNPGDPWEPHIALLQDNVSNHLVTAIDHRVNDYQWHQVHLTVGEETIQVYLDESLVLEYSGTIDRTFSKIGFGGAVGGLNDWHIIDDVQIYSQGGQMDWLSINPSVGDIPTEGNQQVELIFDATGLQPQIYSGGFFIRSNDPVNSRLTVPVSLTVQPTADMGQVSGSIFDAWTEEPLTATVELVGVYSMLAGPDYDIWAVSGPYSITAYTAGYYTVTLPVEVITGEVTVLDIELEPSLPRLGELPVEISMSIPEGASGTQALELWNTGPMPLDFAFNEVNPLRSLKGINSLIGKHILNDRSHCQEDLYGYSNLISDLQNAGATVDENFERFDDSTLAGYDILWLNIGSCTWRYGELQILDAWLAQGGAVLIQSDNSSASSGPASVFGIDYEAGGCYYCTTENITPHSITEGVDQFYIDWTDHYLSGSPEAVILDLNMRPHLIAAEQGRGKMVVVAGRDFSDYVINKADNRLVAMNAFQWLSLPVYVDIPWLSETPQQGSLPGHSGYGATLNFDASGLTVGEYEGSLVIEHSDPNQDSPVIIPLHLTVTEPETITYTVYLPVVTNDQAGK